MADASQAARPLIHLERVVAMHPHPEERLAIFARYMERQRDLAAQGTQRSTYAASVPGETSPRPTA